MTLPLPMKAQSSALANQPAGVRHIAFIADSIAAHGDTVRALAILDSAVRKNPKDGPSWNRIGLLQLAMVGTRRSAKVMKDQKDIRRMLQADSALRLATQYSPDSSQYWLDLMRYSLSSGYASVRLAADGQSSKALDAAARAGDSVRVAIAADEHGMSAWRRYEVQGNRAILPLGQKVDLAQLLDASGTHSKDLDLVAHKIEPPTGTGSFNDALSDFRRSAIADPTSLRSSRHLFMALAEKGRWEEMVAEGKRRATMSPFDYQAWLALGLANHRLGKEKDSKAAFDSAFAKFDDETAARFDRLTRIVRPNTGNRGDRKKTKEGKMITELGDSANYAAMSPAERKNFDAVYWMLSDPLVATPENELRLEFLSRVTFSEFLWTNEDQKLHGADTDRGDLHVRYGPPDRSMTISGSTGDDGARESPNSTLVWAYNNGLMFVFDLPPGFGTAQVAFDNKDAVSHMEAAVPVAWTNVPVTRILDSIATRNVRFRASKDSTDVLVTALIPMDSLISGMKEVDRLPVDVDIRIYDARAITHGVESVQSSVKRDSTAGASRRMWTRRVGPGANVVRIEALQADTKRAARSMAIVNTVAETGFGMSDILFGGPAQLDASTVKRWSDVDITPTMGAYKRGSPVGFVWEMYDLTAKDGAVNYQVRISVLPVDKKNAISFAVKLLSGLGQTLGKDAKSTGALATAYPRSAPARSIVVDNMTLDLSQSPVGDYTMTLEITDLVAKKVTTRTSVFSIRP
ncbi:MAG: GWxTD domain-containing protein [Gemmatimonadaceae bacterium]